MTATPDRRTVLDALEAVGDPKSGKGLSSAGLIKGLVIASGRAGFMLEVAREDAELYAPVRDAAEKALKALPGIDRAQVVLTAESRGSPAPARSAKLSEAAVNQTRAKAPVPQGRPAHVRKVIAVASGKGGVGKSTVAVNLACALAAQGLNAGLLDADVYGPSAPTMLGVSDAPEYGEDKKLVPKAAWGLKMMSIGLLVGADQAMIWRGPMATQALSQMLGETRWGTEEAPLDVLVVDLPPGTGDVQLTLVQRTKLDGVVVVSTPQEVALADARRAVRMFGKLPDPAPILGVVENMAYFADSSGAEIPIFGRGGAKAEAERLGVPFLGEVPIELAIREGGDAGRPIVAADANSAGAKAFAAIASAVRKRLEL